MYTGSEPCPGCGRTGKEEARQKREELCYDCKKEIEIGRAIAKERNLSRHNYSMNELIIGQLTWYAIPINEIHNALCHLLQTFSQFDKRYAVYNDSWKGSQLTEDFCAVTAHDTFVLPDITFEAAKLLCEKLKNACYQLKDERENYQKKIDEKLREEKNLIYNEGVTYGRNLLGQLNRGEIGVNEFEAFITKY